MRGCGTRYRPCLGKRTRYSPLLTTRCGLQNGIPGDKVMARQVNCCKEKNGYSVQ